MVELFLCSMLTILPDFLYRRFVQGKRLGHEINLFTVWFELRWGITLCLLLTLSLITTIFYFHPATKAANSMFRTVTIMPEKVGRVAETFVELNQRVTAGQPLFRLDSTEQEAAAATAQRKIAEVEAAIGGAKSQLAEADARVVQARASLKQVVDELAAREQVQRRSPGSVAVRDIERLRVQVDTQKGVVEAAVAARTGTLSALEVELPAEKASAEAALQEARVDLKKTLVVAGTDGVLQQFALRPGDVVNPMIKPAGILVPERRATGLVAGFGQIEAQVMKVGMIGEVTCIAMPWKIVPVVVTEVQNVIASGQVRQTDQLLDVQQMAVPGTITVIMEPLYPGQLDALPQGGSCIANAYTSNHEALQSNDIGALHRFGLHAIDTVGLVHAMILRIQALLLPMQVLVFGGH
ncbi:HlyD family secretion protein [Candidatus Thiodictyon syntrophicum]|jgi:multidrug resistance efflux pump|uniref:Secretion protein HlyD n=1 Tax=Candidatus Thiodictyon syntrophicum TaxID=1166950 RepID=A0A2K8UIT2_9GAMM|nr:biotin/lipoyl-binding protein [Candidatus Thiodictyon syntrophicum]AUB85445.1 secretion protein HlyD [Candidatus Thiodictyon syntrophicum]